MLKLLLALPTDVVDARVLRESGVARVVADRSFRLGVCVPTVHPRVDDARGFDDRGGGVRPTSRALALVDDVAEVDAIGPVEVLARTPYSSF